MFTRDHLFIGGRWSLSADGRVLEVRSPATEAVVGRVPRACATDVDHAVAAARLAADEGPWPHLPLAERAAALHRLVDAIEQRAGDLVDAQVSEMGAPRKFVASSMGSARFFVDRCIADSTLVPTREVRAGTAGDVLVTRDPIGVVAGIVPSNTPVMIALSKLAPALVMGCPIVLKPAIESSLSAFLLADAVHDVGLPTGVVSILTGGSDVGERLVGHTGVDAVSFTGSTAAGRRVGAICAEQIKRCTLELGGKSAAILTEGEDVGRHLDTLLSLSLMNAGQVCVATSRVLVHRTDRDRFLAAFVDRVAAMKVGDPSHPDTDVGPLITAEQRDRVERFIAEGRRDGADVVLGGGRPVGLDRGWYVEPTIFSEVERTMSIAQEEIFGPVVCVQTYTDDDEAVEIANDSRYGLGGAVLSSDLERAMAIASRVRTGTFSINDGPVCGGGGPFGGVKQSGLGHERGPEGLQALLSTKSIALPRGARLDGDLVLAGAPDRMRRLTAND